MRTDIIIYVDTIGFYDTNNIISNKAIREQIVDGICALADLDAKIVFLDLCVFLFGYSETKIHIREPRKLIWFDSN